jgi:hypothetical protein
MKGYVSNLPFDNLFRRMAGLSNYLVLQSLRNAFDAWTPVFYCGLYNPVNLFGALPSTPPGGPGGRLMCRTTEDLGAGTRREGIPWTSFARALVASAFSIGTGVIPRFVYVTAAKPSNANRDRFHPNGFRAGFGGRLRFRQLACRARAAQAVVVGKSTKTYEPFSGIGAEARDQRADCQFCTMHLGTGLPASAGTSPLIKWVPTCSGWDASNWECFMTVGA